MWRRRCPKSFPITSYAAASHGAIRAAAALQLIETGRSEAVVVSLGADGALLASREGCERFTSPEVKVQSRVGAGDSMVAAIALALSRDESIRNAVRFGVAAGAAAVMNPSTELCRREDTERLFRQIGR